MNPLLFVALLTVTSHANAMTCLDWRNVAQAYATARDQGVPEATVVKAVSDSTAAGRLPRSEYEDNLGVITGVYHAPALKYAAPETIGHIAEITCHTAHWEKE